MIVASLWIMDARGFDLYFSEIFLKLFNFSWNGRCKQNGGHSRISVGVNSFYPVMIYSSLINIYIFFTKFCAQLKRSVI